MDFMSLVILVTLVACVTYSFEIVFGLAGTILMIMFLGFFIDPKFLVVYSLLPQVLVGTIGLARSPKNVELPILGGMLFFAAFGAFIGIMLFEYLSAEHFRYVLASAITFFGILLVASPGRLRLSPLAARVLDVIAGLSQGLFGISGPIAMTRMLATFDHKTLVRNYALAFFLGANAYRAIAYGINGTITAEIGWLMLYSAPALMLTLWFTNHLHFHINEALFRRVVAWAILAGGLAMLFS